ncbi:hypothetical protein NKK52_19755 [Mesorhizobium sp. C277A]|uniref:hypothetical protein n=1 Tax=Mesorhizobium sp. C277A TaxID=2956827 RepID=UPI0003CEA4E5|nr:hypothetical protein [Mesorhizobium sp. LSJC277A00]ESW67739.1 hypothetical protein X771_13500 [Mesorhizobium sp. LSJC277A00]
METDKVGPITEGESDAGDQNDPRRERSTIEFPYMDLAMATEIAAGVYNRNGGGEVQADELAAHLKLSSNSSGFRTRIATAKTFGLVQSARGSDNIALTDLGLKIVDGKTNRRARADAFLQVELFRTIYEKYKGAQLPPAAALERRMIEFGVAPKQAERARQVLERSAETAGYFESGRDRLVRPANIGVEDADKQKTGNGGGGNGQGGDGGSGDNGKGKLQREIHPAVLGILEILPPVGSPWPIRQRAKWLSSLNNVFELIYTDEDSAEVEISTVEIRD